MTNVAGLTPPEIVARYPSLADIERGFGVLKSEIDIAPVFHRLPKRIRAPALICFLALVLYRVLPTMMTEGPRQPLLTGACIGDRAPRSASPGHAASHACVQRAHHAQFRAEGVVRQRQATHPTLRNAL